MTTPHRLSFTRRSHWSSPNSILFHFSFDNDLPAVAGLDLVNSFHAFNACHFFLKYGVRRVQPVHKTRQPCERETGCPYPIQSGQGCVYSVSAAISLRYGKKEGGSTTVLKSDRHSSQTSRFALIHARNSGGTGQGFKNRPSSFRSAGLDFLGACLTIPLQTNFPACQS